MPAPSPLPVRTVPPERWEDLRATMSRGFGSAPDPAEDRHDRETWEHDRDLGAWDGDEIVATACAFSFQMTVPGAVVPAAGVTGVAVLPTHRRRGVLTALMTRQLADVRDAGREPFAALWASEAPIYGRFGYGLANQQAGVTVPAAHAGLAPDAPGGDLTARLREPDTALADLAAVHDAVLAQRPGRYRRSAAWWRRVLAQARHGVKPPQELRCVVVDDDAGPAAYALYRVRPHWTRRSVPDGEVLVREVVGRTPAAYSAVWRHLLGIDLADRVSCGNLAADDPLLHLLTDPRRAEPTLQDALWVRLVDVPAALAARRYAADVAVTVRVVDRFCPWNEGTYRLDGGADGAQCRRVEGAADLTLDVRDLGAAYLGGTRLVALGLAGRVDEDRPGALAAASRAFAADPLPHCLEVF